MDQPVIILGGDYSTPPRLLRELHQMHVAPIIVRPQREPMGWATDKQIAYTFTPQKRLMSDMHLDDYVEDNACQADPDGQLRLHRTNKKLKNQPFYQRNRNGKMKNY